MKLTKTTASKIQLPPGKSEIRVFDDDLTGFGLRIRASGKRTWIIQYRINGRSNTLPIGRVDKVPAAAARARAKKDLAQAALGTDPSEKRQIGRVRASETFETVAVRFLKAKQDQIKPSSYDQVETHLTKHWAPFNRLSVHAIARRDVASRLGEIAADRGPYAANRARSTLSTFFTWTMNEGIVDTNPVIGTNKQTDEKSRDRVLSDPELVGIWKACNDDDYGRIVRLLILTGQRRDEIGAIAKSELALDARKWTIPRARTKNGLAHEVPLSDAALTILQAATTRAGREDRDAIFGESGDGHGFSGWSKAKAALDERIDEAPAVGREKAKSKKDKEKRSPWRIHDIRRTVATRMADLGVLPHVIEAVLNHISGHRAGVAGVYNRAAYSAEKRQALDLWAAHVEALVAGKSASNILPMKA